MKLTCNKCGYSKELLPFDAVEELDCPLCKGSLMGEARSECYNGDNYAYKETDDDLLTTIDIVIEETMKNNIKVLGNDEVFRIIEGFQIAELRLAYRKYFLKVGGVIPETEIKEE